MDKLLEYVAHHPLLVGGTAALAAAALIYELSRARNAGDAVGPLDAVRLLNQGALLLDVRSKAEFDSGHVIDARHVAQEDIAASAETLKKYREKVVIACCESGMRSSAAARALKAQGFTKVVNLRGGLAAWRGENLPLVKSDAKGRQSS
jgi:rhodanese-related sulfurtransferase